MTPNPPRKDAASNAVSFPASITAAEPFDGIVNIHFRGVVIASSEYAVEVRCADGRVFHLAPFRDVNFELLEECDAEATEVDGLGYWDVVAAGERVPMAVGVIEHPPSDYRHLVAHAAFLSDDLEVDIIPKAEKVQRVADWPP